MRTHCFPRACAGLFAAIIGAATISAEQAGSTRPQEQTTYQTKGIVLDTRELADWARASYWEQRIGEIFKITVDPRIQTDMEERDAVLATVWQVKPAMTIINAETRVIAIIPKRPTKPQSKDLAYQIIFTPRTSAKEKDGVEVRFIAEGLAATPIAASASEAAIPRLPSSYSYAGFPQNIARYWAAHPDEMKNILTWIGISANPGFEQILVTNSVEGGVVRSASFHVRGTKVPAGPILQLGIVFLGATVPITSNLPAHYNAKDFADLQIERIQTGQDQDKLGGITGLAELPVEERIPAKAAIWQYFGKGTRNAEVDAIVPIPNTDKLALLTLRFEASNNVSIQRIGERKKGEILERLGDVREVNGFGANSADVPTFVVRLKKRYPAITPKGATVAELANSATADIQARSTTPAWFKDNYGIDVLAASAAQVQLPRKFQYDTKQLADLKDFIPSELQVLEATLEKMNDHLLSRLKGVQMVRQKTSVALIGVTETKLAINEPAEAGMARLRGNDRLIVMFDSSGMNSQSLFSGGLRPGGKPEVASQTFSTFAHEIGHVIAATPGMKDGFDGLIKTKKIKPVTWYSAFNPKDEFFAEAFMLYLSDPEWLKENRSDLFGWFETLSRDKSKS